MTDAERFMEHYMEVWPSFDADRLDVAVDPEATIHHSGMARPIRGREEPDYVRAIRALMPDISLEVANWAASGDVVFIEYEMSGTLAGQPLSWTGIGRFKLRGERAIDAIGRWDNLDLLARIDPSVSATAFAETAARLVGDAKAAG
jgi:hypothetical protein